MDYTKCDFSSIIGAKVEVEVLHPTYHIVGTLLCREKWEDGYGGQDSLCVLLKEWDGNYIKDVNLDGFHDVVKSIKATMIPRDMNHEQLHRFAREIALEHYGDRYDGIESIAFTYDEKGELSDEIDVSLCGMPPEDGFVLDPNRPVDVTHWVREGTE